MSTNGPVINAALLSFGMSGRVFHAPFLDHLDGFNLVGSWERSSKTIQDHYPSARSFDSLEEVLSDEKVDLIVVNTPTLTHYDYAKAALEHDKHVVVEKAFAGSAAEAIELQTLAQEKQKKLAVFQNRRWDSDFMSIRDVLGSGKLGEIIEANLGYLRYDPNLSPKWHKEEPSSGSGIVKDLGPHVIDQAIVLFGMPDGVFADIGITRTDSRVDDYFDILLAYDDKRVHVRGGYFFRHPPPEYSLYGTEGSFFKTRSDVQEAQLQEGMKPADSAYGKEPDSAAGLLYAGPGADEGQRVIAPVGCYLEFYKGVCLAIANDQPEPVTAADGVNVMKIIDAAQQSAREGRLVTP